MPPFPPADPVLVTGAAGKTGQAVLRAFAEKGLAARALVRDDDQGRVVEELGAAEVVTGDLLDDEAVHSAARGARAVYHICPNVHPDEIAIGRRVIAAAKEAGVERFVLHSVLHPQIEAMPHHWAKLRVEEHLLASGLPCTILQPAPYMQNLLGQWQRISERHVYTVPYAVTARIAMVDLDDVAEVAAIVLRDARHAGATYELCGPDLLDQEEIATLLGRHLGRPVRAEAVPRDAWSRQAALEPRRLATLLEMFRYYERHGMAGSPAVLEWLLGRRPTDLREFLERQAGAAPNRR